MMENIYSTTVTTSESLQSVDNSEVQKRECVNTMLNDEQHCDLNKANVQHTTHVHTVETADFVENELASNIGGTQPHVVDEVLAQCSADISVNGDYDEPSITYSEIDMLDSKIEMETENELMSTRQVEIEDEKNSSSVMEGSEEEKKDKFDVQKLNYELQVGYKILTSLMGAGNRFVNKLFLHPVDDNFPETSEYYSKIKEPMWMHKMKEKFEALEYNNLAEFMADFKLMIENCYRFNGPDNFVSKKAQKLETMMKQKIALLSKDLRSKILGSSSTDDEMLASAGIRRRVRNPNLAAEDESQVLLSQLRRDKALQDREDRRQRVEDKKALEAARIQEIQNWEDEFLGEDIREGLRTMWELPQIGMFVYLCMECLGLDEEVTQYQLERGIAAPRECSDFRRLMTCLLSTQNQRKSVKSHMPYAVWNKKLSQKLDHFYKVLSDCGGNHQQACYKLGFDNRAFKVMGKANPLLKKQFHQLSFVRRVWILKCYCDFCVESQNYLQKTVEEAEAERPMDVREVLLGSDGRGYRYINFPMFTGKDIRIYRHPKLQEPSLHSLGMENWSMVDDKHSASSSRCSTPVNQKRYSEPQSSSLRARAILQAAESNDPSPVRTSPDFMLDENSNSNQGASSATSETSTKKGSATSYKKRKRTGYTGKRKRLKNNAASRREVLAMDEFTDSPGTGTEKEEDGTSVKGDDNDVSQGFNVPKFDSVKDHDKTCDNNSKTCLGADAINTTGKGCDNKGEDSEKQTLSSTANADLNCSKLSSSVALSAKNVETSPLPIVAQSGCVTDKESDNGEVLRTISDKVDSASGVGSRDEVKNPDIEMKEGGEEGDSSGRDKVPTESNSFLVESGSEQDKVDTERSSSENDSGLSKNQDSAYFSCDSEKSFKNKTAADSEEKVNSFKKENDTEDVTGVVKTDSDKKDVKMENYDVKPEILTSNVKKEEDTVMKSDKELQSEQLEFKKEIDSEDAKKEPTAEAEESDEEEDLPDLGRIELVAESMEGIRNLMNRLSNPEPIKRGKRVYPGVVKPCEEELLENLTRFHDELVKYEKSLFNARIHAQIKLRKEVDSYVEPKVEESKGWESETSQSSKNSSDDEEEAAGGSDAPSSSNKKEKLQKVASVPTSAKKSKKSMTELLSSAASKLASLNGDANNEDSNDSYELDISSRGRLRKRRVIPNNTEDTLLKKRKNLNQESTTVPTTTTTTLPLSSPTPSPLSTPTNSATIAGIHNRNPSQILSMLASSQSNLAFSGNKPNSSMPCQIVRFISPGGDASPYKTVRLISPGAGGKTSMVLASPEKFAGASANIQFVSSTGIVTIPRSKLLASTLTSTTQSSHPVIQNLLKSQGNSTANQVVFQKNMTMPTCASGVKQQQGAEQQRLLLSKMLSSNVKMSNSQTMTVAGITGAVNQAKQQPTVVPLKSVVTPSSTATSAAVVVTQVSNSFISQGGKQVLDLGSLSVTQIQQLVKNQAIQIHTGAGNSTTLLLTTGLQQLSAAAASNKGGAVSACGVGSVAGVASTTLASAGAAGNVKLDGTQHQIKVPAPNMAGFSNTTLLGKTLQGQHMTVIPRHNLNLNSGNKNSSQQALPVIRTIINRPALNAVRTTLPSSTPAMIGINNPQQQQQQQVPGLYTIVSGAGATTIKQIPVGTPGIINNNQAAVRISANPVVTSSIIGQNNIIPAVNLNNQQQQLFTIVSGGGTALKQIPAPRIISSLNQNVFIASSASVQGANNTSNVSNTNSSNKENPLSSSNGIVTHSNCKSPASSSLSSSPASGDPQKHNWVTIPTKKYAGNVTVKALLENRNATKRPDGDVSRNSNNGDSDDGNNGISANAHVGIESTNKTEAMSHVNIQPLSACNELTTSQQGTPLPASAKEGDVNAQTLQINLVGDGKEPGSSVPVTQALSVDAAIQPLLVSSLQVTLPTVNIKVPSPNTLPSLTHNKNSTTIVQSTKVPIPVASTVDSNLSPITQITNATSNYPAAGTQVPPLPITPTNQIADTVCNNTVNSSKSQTQVVLNLNNLNAVNNSNLNTSNSPNNPTDLKNVMLKLTPPKGGTGQFVQGYMTSQGKLVIPQAALFQQQQQQNQAQVLQTGPTRVILANNSTLSTTQPNQIAQAAAKIPTALISGNNGSPQVRIATPSNINNNNNSVNNVLPVNNQVPTGVHILGQQNNQLVLAANTAAAARHLQPSGVTQNFQQQPNSVASGSLSARAIPVQSGNPGIKLMLINPSAVPGLQNNTVQTIQQQPQQQQVINVNRSVANSGNSILVSSSAYQQNQQAVQTSTPASELVKQIAANSTQLQAASATAQQQPGSSGNNANTATGKPTQHTLQQQSNNAALSQCHIPGSQANPVVSPLAAQILTLQQQANKIQPQQIQGSQIVFTKPQQQQQQQAHQTPQQQPGAISLQLQNVNQLLSSQGVNIRSLAAAQQIQVPNTQLQQHQQQPGVQSAPAAKQIPQAHMVQLAINAQNGNAAAGTVVAQSRVVQVASQLSPQIQLSNQSPLQSTVVPRLIIQQQQPAAVLQSAKQLMAAPGSSIVQLQQNNPAIQQQPKVVVTQQPPPQQQQSGDTSPSIQPQQKQLPSQLGTNPPQVIRQQQQVNLPTAMAANQIQIQNQNQNQAQIQFVINPSAAASTANLARLAKPLIHPVIRAVTTSPTSSSPASFSLSTNNITTSLKSPSSSRPQQIVLSQNLPHPSPPSSSSNQFIISPVKLGSSQNPQGNPQTRLMSPLKLVTPVQNIIQQPGGSLSDQRTSQLVMQNTSQLHNLLHSSKLIPPAGPNTRLPRPSTVTPAMVANSSLVDGSNKLLNSSSINQSSSFNLKPQNVIVPAAVGSLSQQQTLAVVSVNGAENAGSSSQIVLENSGLNRQNGLDSNGVGVNDSTTGAKQQQGVRRNTFCGSQEVPKLAMAQRQKSVDESTSEENDEKEAALNLLTLANQPL